MIGIARSADVDDPEPEAKKEARRSDEPRERADWRNRSGLGWPGDRARFAEVGHKVIASDSAEKVEALSRGEMTIDEPGLKLSR